MNTNDILSMIGKTEQHLETVKSQLFTVEKLALPSPKEGFDAPLNTYGVYKGSGGGALSVMGKDFTPMQPQEFMDNIIHTVHECGANLDLETLKFREFCGGRKIEFSIKMYPISFKNNKGLQDITNVELTFSTSYDGTKSNIITLYTERLVCKNGMVARGIEGILKGKNTVGGKAKILSYCDEVANIINAATDFKERMMALDKIKPSKEQIEQFKLQLLGYNAQTLEESENKETKKLNILKRIDESIALEFERTGETAFGLLQGITYYTNHVANNSKEISDEEFIRFYNGAKLNDKAQELVFAMI